MLRRSGYINPVVASSMENKIRRMVRRQSIDARDARLWLGMLKQVLWKLTSGTGE